MKMITYWRRIRCRWVRVTTDLATWRRLPHVTIGAGCAAGIGIGGALAMLPPAHSPATLRYAPPPPIQMIAAPQPSVWVSPRLVTSGQPQPWFAAAHPAPPVPVPEPGLRWLFVVAVAGTVLARRDDA